jgi:hypothetical protein
LILSSDLTLEAVLGGAVAANQPEFHVDYVIFNNQGANSKPAVARGALNSTTDVTLISPSANGYSTQGFIAEVKGLSIYNKDTSSVTVTVKTTDGTDRIKCKATLASTETLIYDKEGQFYVMTADGAFKNDSISYAESDWTPVLTFATPGDLSVTYSTQFGKATKIGRQVTLHFALQTSAFTHTTASGNCQITGAPYTSVNATNFFALSSLLWRGITKANYTDVCVQIPANDTILSVVASGSGQAFASVTAADMPTGGTVGFRGVITYLV